MGRRLATKVLTSAGALFLLSMIIFLFTRLSGDPASLLLPMDAPPEQLAAMQTALGLDQPLPVQFARYLRGVIGGDFGRSLRYQEPALQLVLERIPATIQMAVAAAAVGWLIAIPLGILAGWKPNSTWDGAARLVALFGQSMPIYWLGILLIMLFAVRLQLLPAAGRGDWRYLVLPAAALSLNLMGSVTRILRVSIRQTLRQDYIRTARAKGVHAHMILFKHALKNASLGAVTVMGLQLGSLLGGTVVTETVFAWPGLGRLIVQSIQYRDFPVVQTGVLFLAAAVLAVNSVVDLLYPLLDSRLRT